jgi:tetratricopeptide (TPR) repeat protein
MSHRSRDDEHLEILRRAAQHQAVPDGPHPVDDEDLLLRWSLGDLTSREQAGILKHLAACRQCRTELAAMVRAGAIQLPEVESEEVAPALPPPSVRPARQPTVLLPPPRRSTGLRGRIWALTAMAASLLVAVIAWQLWQPRTGALLALAQRDLAVGNAASAMDRLENLVRQNPRGTTKTRALELLEESGYAVARGELNRGGFQQALDAEQRVCDWQKPSARLVNLKLQAKRHIPGEYELARAGSLTDYGYQLDGSSSLKSFPVGDEATDRLIKEFRQALAEHPEGVGLMINYGQLLLGLGRFAEAREQFAAAAGLAPDNGLARLGMGLVAFEMHEYEQAAKDFEQASSLDPQNLSAWLNAAMCLEQLGRTEEARACWRRAAALTEDAELRQKIEGRLAGGGSQR